MNRTGTDVQLVSQCDLLFVGVRPVWAAAILAAPPGVLCVKRPWPGLARTCFGDHPRFLATYLNPYPNYFLTGDGCRRDQDG
jgi:acyl-coenzyme A synthetase/AMP-(fatty) acid ligase